MSRRTLNETAQGDHDHSQTFQSRRAHQGGTALQSRHPGSPGPAHRCRRQKPRRCFHQRGTAAAEEAGLDLVEISPNADPPVAKILDLGKLKYANQKKAAEARKNQKVIEIKEIKMRPNIDNHDYEVKMKAVRRFFEEGDKVKLTLRFRGREMAHMELGMQLLNKVREETATIAKVEAEPKLEGRQMMMVLAPR